MRTIAVALLSLIGVAFCVFTAFMAATYIHIGIVKADQVKRLDALKAEYASGERAAVDERAFCDFDIDDAIENGALLTDLQVIGTHNSYKMPKTPLENFYSNLESSLRTNDYSYPSPTDQLDMGIRSLEFDLFCSGYGEALKFNCFHIGFLDMSSYAFDFALLLEELDLWSVNNPGHLPVTVLIEVKESGAVMLPYRTMSADSLEALDRLIRDKVSTLYSPHDAQKGYSSLNDMRASGDVPTLEETLGKIIFVLHPGDRTQDYVTNCYPSADAAVFPASGVWWESAIGDQKFVIVNSNGFMGRGLDNIGGHRDNFFTRVLVKSASSEFRRSMLARAISQGANIISTNCPPGIGLPDDEAVCFEGGKTARLISRMA